MLTVAVHNGLGSYCSNSLPCIMLKYQYTAGLTSYHVPILPMYLTHNIIIPVILTISSHTI